MSYNDASRLVVVEVDIYFSEMLTVHRDNYLISYWMQEETGEDDIYPLGKVSSNKIRVTIDSPQGLFNPESLDSNYSKQIKRGLKMIPRIKCNEGSWETLGTYYVTDWEYSGVTNTVEVECVDKLELKLFQQLPYDTVDLRTTISESFNKLIDAPVEVPGTLEAFTGETSWSDTIDKLSEASRTFCHMDRSGNIRVEKVAFKEPLIITDNDQIVYLENKNRLPLSNTEVSIQYHNPQVIKSAEVVNMSSYLLEEGKNTIESIDVSGDKVISYLLATVRGASQARVSDLTGSASYCDLEVIAVDEDEFDIAVKAMTLRYVAQRVNTVETGDYALSVQDNKYIQEIAVAQKVLNMYKTYLLLTTPEIVVDVIGDPGYRVGQSITAQSDRFHISYSGIIKRVEHDYDGALSGRITILNESVVGAMQ